MSTAVNTGATRGRVGRPPGSTRTRIVITHRSTGESIYFNTYADAARRLGITGKSLRIYLSKGKGTITRSVWSDVLGTEDLLTVRRIGVDPLNYSS